MRRSLARTFLGVAMVVLATTMPAAPASATVHEIVAQWCAGHEPLEPPGISDPAKPNFARPLNANGFIGEPVPFVGDAGPGLLVSFNYDHPAAKVVGTGIFIVIGTTPAGPLYLELIAPSADFPAFKHCPRLVVG